jgi:hypothetical protein
MTGWTGQDDKANQPDRREVQPGESSKTRARWTRYLAPVGFWTLVAASLALAALLTAGSSFGPVNWMFGKVAKRSMYGGAFVAATFAAIPFTLRFVRSTSAILLRLTVLVLVGAATQHAYILAESKGWEAVPAFVHGAHAHGEMMDIAQDQSLQNLIPRYMQMAGERHWLFPQSKPPGALLVYRGLALIAGSSVGAALATMVYSPRAAPGSTQDLRHRMDAVAIVLLPLFTFLTVVPLFFLARLLVGEPAAEAAVLLYTFAPSVGIVWLYLDSALYPLVACTSAVALLAGLRLGRATLIVTGGAVISAGLFVTFSILPVAGLLATMPTLHALTSAEPVGIRRRILRALRDTGLFALGLLLAHAIPLALGYQLAECFRHAMHFHETWWSGGGHPWTVASPIQFAVWIGLPVSLAFLVEVISTVKTGSWRRSLSAAYVVACLILLVVTAFTSHARIETMRLWLFWVPFVCLAAASRIIVWEAALGRTLVQYVVLTQVVTAFLLKVSYAFY